MYLIKAVLIGAVLITGILTIPVVIAFLAPILTFTLVVTIIWGILKLLQDDDPDPPDETEAPP